MMKERVKEQFPFSTYREKQVETLDAITEAFKENDVVLLEAPTGTGKSPINMAFCHYYDSAYYTTPQKTLQKQLIKDFGEDSVVTEIKGRANYTCVLDENFNCKDALCQRKDSFDCPKEESCSYLLQKQKAIHSKITVSNFAYLLAEGMIPRTGESQGLMPWKRDLLVVDEGHGLTSFVENFVDMMFSYKNLPPKINKFPWLEDMEDTKKFLKNILAEYQVYRGSFAKPFSEDEKDELDMIKKQEWKIQHFFKELDKGKEWVFAVKGKGQYKRLILKPVFVSDFIRENVWTRGDKIIISSATIIDKHSFMREVGLNPENTVLIKVGMTFPAKNRLIHYEPVGKMTRTEEESTFPKAVEKIAEIVLNHEKERGLIHCHSYKRLEKLYTTFGELDRFMFHGRGNRAEKFNEWLDKDVETDNTVFVSAGFSEGIDLYDDLCRFQILLKIPYPYLGDIRTAYRVNELGMWKMYNVDTLKNIVQSYGRAVRSKDDYADFYIIDESYDVLKTRFKYLFPDWFLEAEN